MFEHPAILTLHGTPQHLGKDLKEHQFAIAPYLGITVLAN